MLKNRERKGTRTYLVEENGASFLAGIQDSLHSQSIPGSTQRKVEIPQLKPHHSLSAFCFLLPCLLLAGCPPDLPAVLRRGGLLLLLALVVVFFCSNKKQKRDAPPF